MSFTFVFVNKITHKIFSKIFCLCLKFIIRFLVSIYSYQKICVQVDLGWPWFNRVCLNRIHLNYLPFPLSGVLDYCYGKLIVNAPYFSRQGYHLLTLVFNSRSSNIWQRFNLGCHYLQSPPFQCSKAKVLKSIILLEAPEIKLVPTLGIQINNLKGNSST